MSSFTSFMTLHMLFILHNVLQQQQVPFFYIVYTKFYIMQYDMCPLAVVVYLFYHLYCFLWKELISAEIFIDEEWLDGATNRGLSV